MTYEEAVSLKRTFGRFEYLHKGTQYVALIMPSKSSEKRRYIMKLTGTRNVELDPRGFSSNDDFVFEGLPASRLGM